MLASPRCGAKIRKGTPCQAQTLAGKKRCRMHGGAKGSRAPIGNQNALRVGLHTAKAKALRKHIRDLTRDSKGMIEKF
ncbi:MAG: HGGxSTG domain-containing protein [Pseudomonadota bacterium]